MKKNLLLLLLLITYVGYSQSIIIGTGTTITNGTTADPVERYYNYTHSQIVWTAAELTTAGLPSGASISGMGFSISESAVSLSNFTISMGHTGQTLANPMVASGLSVVKNAFTYAPIVQAAGSFDMITFDTPFAWDGTSNIVIDICTGSNPFTSPYGGLRTSTATSGAMRIYRLDGSSNCGNYTTGTNYSVRPNVQFNYTSSGCSGTPTPGNTLASANPVCPSATSTLTLQNATTGSGVTYQWFSSTDGVTYNPIGGATESSYVASQAIQTYYYCDVTCSGNTGSSAPVLVTMNNFLNCYCTAVPTSIDGNGITDVVIGTLSNPNVFTTTYQDFSALPAPDLAQGTSATLTVTLATGYTYNVRAFIDFNQDGDFNDANENTLIGLSSSTNPTSIVNTIAVPLTAVLGQTRMRIVATDNDTSNDPCWSSSFANVEDYTVNIIPAPSCLPPSALTATNITSNSAELSWTDSNGSSAWEVEYGLSGFTPGTGTMATTTNPYILGSLASATVYQYYVRSDCGGSFSTWSGPYSFTTLCAPVTAPTSVENFDTFTGAAPSPLCWSEATGTLVASTTLSGTTSAWLLKSNGFANITSTNKGASINLYSTKNDWLISNEIDLGATPGLYRVRYRYAVTSYNGTTVQSTLGTHRVDVVVSTDGGVTWSNANSIRTYTGVGTYSNTGEYETIELTGYSGVVKIAFVASTTSTFPDIDFHIDDFSVETIPTDTPDYVSLQWPPNATITRTSTVDVYGQVYEGGLTDVEPGLSGQAAGIQVWVGISPQGQNTNPNTWTNWVPATWNTAHISNNDEYMASIGATLSPGTYYYATRFSLNDGPYRYGGIDASNNGNFWDGVTYNSGVLTVTPLPGDNCSVAIDLGVLTSPLSSTTVGGTDEANHACATNTAPDMHYKIDVPYGYRLDIQQTVNNYDSKNYVFYGDCITQTSIACFDDPDNTAVSWLNDTGSTQTVYWINDGFLSDSGTFTLQWSVTEEPCYFTTTWDGSAWSNGTPVANTRAIINGNYNGPGFTACALDVTGTAVVTLAAGEVFNIDGAISVAGTATLELANDAYVLQNQNVANTGTTVVNRMSAPMIRLDYTAWGTPVAGQMALPFSPNTVTNRFYTYDPAGTDTATSWIIFDPSVTTLVAGTGYLIRAANNWPAATYTPFLGVFTGVLNNGDYSVAAGVGYNLIGNPYPSPIDADVFLADNSGIGATTMYFWTHTIPSSGGVYAQNNYASYTTAGGVAAAAGGAQPDGIVQVGQGFFINATSAGNAQFNNAQRVGSSSGQFFKNASVERHRYWLNLSNQSNACNQMLVAYMTGATNEVDAGIDGKLFTNSLNSIASFVNNESYVIQGRSLSFDVNDEVPLIFKADTNSNYTISLDHFDGFFENQDIFIWDKQQNVIHDLKASAYNFSTIAGEYSNRFSIVYTNSALSENDFQPLQVLVYTSNNSILINADKTNINQVIVYDMQGRKLVSKEIINSTEATIENTWQTNQILIVEVFTENGRIVKKIIL